MIAGLGGFATAFGAFVHAGLGHDAVVLVGEFVDAANRSVVRWADVVSARPGMSHLDVLQPHVASISVGDPVLPAYKLGVLVLALGIPAMTPRSELFEICEHDTDVSELLIIRRTHRVVVVRAEVSGVKVRRTSPKGGLRHLLALKQTLVGVSNPVDSANRPVFVFAMRALADQ